MYFDDIDADSTRRPSVDAAAKNSSRSSKVSDLGEIPECCKPCVVVRFNNATASSTGSGSDDDGDGDDHGDGGSSSSAIADDFLKYYCIPKKRVQTHDEAALGLDPNEGPPVLDALFDYEPADFIAALLPTHAVAEVAETLGDDGLAIEGSFVCSFVLL